MADSRTRLHSAEGRSTSARSRAGRANTSATDILSKEEEYKRLNDELEAKTARLVHEAEQVMRGQEAALAKSHLLDNIESEDFLKEFDDELTERNEDLPSKPSSRSSSKQGMTNNKTVAKPSPRSNASSRPTSRNNGASRPPSRSKPHSARNKYTDHNAQLHDDVASFMTDIDMSLTKRILQMEETIGDDDDTIVDDVLPSTAADMGSEATIRFLKAKVRVMQEELDRLSEEIHTKEESSRVHGMKVKTLEEEKGRHVRTISVQQTQIDKYKNASEDEKSKSDRAQNQLTTLRKEVDQLKRNQKQATTLHSATEVRLNRALEEVERYKEQLHKSKASSKDVGESDKKRVEQLLSDNKTLEKQKNELMSGFKKQLKLIDILKRQKMHIEAAKMLQFSEDEFVKALEWGN